ncbi:1,4-dihydroxy-2-naphthoate octaprenyltransferase [Flavobacterium okayamense]|uniref:1,4-dihydroxy-2-naphthoate octaprenyltransferase n=1 Tax=Flavobacterium okayamense TaxID=2830782 RepID=A0ABM7S761_9FLAO|nr:1,4-dihydroxy-2-naphthoate octaprenyltransferase [Flavobacterium okayamense]BCY29373.1 1,4-dihydroxy-2-naphthoate octaprenyltransferase [Flavobacterium okayamense]
MKHWIQAARLRTLPLSVSGIFMGSAYAYYQNTFNGTVFGLAILTTLLFQILSNYANDYGDGVKGTDANRIGEKRLVAAGVISAQQMKKAVILFSILSLLSALILIYVAFGKENFLVSSVFILLGIGAIGAAIKYTVGSNAYGYNGMGDLFVFVFFGLVSVVGSNFLYSHFIDWKIFLPAISIGLLSVAVLNLNNMRDIENDKAAGKKTLVVKLGLKKAKRYHEIILAISSVVFMLFCILKDFSLIPILIINISIFMNWNKVNKATKYEDFDPELKKVALSTFALSILFWLTLIFIS